MTDAAGKPESTRLPDGIRVGHWTDRRGWTGCTVLLAPPATVCAGEVSGGGPGTRETDLLSPAAHQTEVQGVLFTGGSAFGLAAADGVMDYLAEQGVGYPAPDALVPLVPTAVVYDLGLGDPGSRPDAQAGRRACHSAASSFERGSVGAGTGATVGKLLGREHWTKGGLGYDARQVGPALVGALAVVNAFGNVLAEDGSVLAGAWNDDQPVDTATLLSGDRLVVPEAGTATTLVCVVTDAALTKTEAWLVARAAGAGVSRSVDPAATAVDGDVVFCLATGSAAPRGGADIVVPVLGAAAAHATAAAIRDAVRQATGAPDCPAAHERGVRSEGVGGHHT